jgi:hypothetical protein
MKIGQRIIGSQWSYRDENEFVSSPNCGNETPEAIATNFGPYHDD